MILNYHLWSETTGLMNPEARGEAASVCVAAGRMVVTQRFDRASQN